MKRFLLLFIALLILTATITAYADNDILLYIDNKKITCDVPPKIINSRTLVPVRALFDAFGAKVEWNANLRQVKITGVKEIILTIGSKAALVDGKRVNMDTYAQIIDSRTLVPVRFISETFGYEVTWNSKRRIVYIDSPEEVKEPEKEKEEEKPVETEPQKPVVKPVETPQQKPVVEKEALITAITLKEKTKYNNTFEIKYTGDEEPNVFYLAYSDCIVMDFYNTKFTSNDAKIRYDNEFVEEVRYAIHDEYARVVIECSGKQGYTTTLKNGIFKVVVGSSSEKFEDSFVVEKDDDTTNENDTPSSDEPKELTKEEIEKLTEDFLKTRDENKLFVVIDPGHGGSDPGAVYVDKNGKDVYEKDPNLYISLQVAKILKQRNIDYVLLREDDTYVDLIERSEIANNLDADLFVSIHNNAIANPDISGCMVLYNGEATYSKYGITSKEVATYINKEIQNHVPVKDRGTVSRPGLSVLKRTVMPAVLIECAFGTNEYDLSLLVDEDKLDLFALAIADGIEQTFKDMQSKISNAKDN